MIRLTAPEFWTDKHALLPKLLAPLGTLYHSIAQLRSSHIAAHKVAVPVICIGNVVVGGAGKTPVAIAIAKKLQAKGKKIFFLSKGYGGALTGPLRVDPALHSAHDVGDEPLLLAEEAPTIVARDRTQGAHLACEQGAELIIMDDGFQNPTLHKDISLLVVDGRYGFGNEMLLPAGPLREPLANAFARASAVILVNETPSQHLRAHFPSSLPILAAHTMAYGTNGVGKGAKIIGFAGIARPEKFYNSLQQLGCEIVMMQSFPDHYPFSTSDITALRERAKEHSATLVTTTKDFVRIPKELREGIAVITIDTLFDDDALLSTIIR